MATWRCPVCTTENTWPPTQPCPFCAAPLQGELGASIAQVERDMAALQDQHRALVLALRSAAAPSQTPVSRVPVGVSSANEGVLARDVAADLGSLGPSGALAGSDASTEQATHPPAHASQDQPSSSRLSGWTAQAVLAACGAGLLALAAVVFLAVTWTRLGATGRAAVLVGATAISGVTARWLRGRDLLSTAEAIAGLTVALTVVVAAAIRIEGVGGADALSLPVYMTGAGVAAAGGLLAWAGWARSTVGQAGAVLVALITGLVAPVAVIEILGTPEASYPLLLAIVAIGLSAAASLVPAHPARRIGHIGLVVLALTTGGGALIVATDGPFGWAIAAAVLVAGWLWRTGRPADLAAVLAAAVPSGVTALGVAQLLEGDALAVIAVAGVALASAIAASALPERRLPAAAGVLPVVAGGVLLAAGPVTESFGLALDALLLAPWEPPPTFVVPTLAEVGALAVGVLAAAALAARCGVERGREISSGLLVLVAVIFASGAALTAGTGWPGQVGLALVVVGVGAVTPSVAGPPSRFRLGLGDLVVAGGATWLLLWSLANRWSTVVAVAVVAGASGLVARRRTTTPATAVEPAAGTLAASAALGLPMIVAAAVTWPAIDGGAVAVAGACTAAVGGPLTAVRERILTVSSRLAQGPAAVVAAVSLAAALWWTVEHSGHALLLPGVAYVLAVGIVATALLSGRLWLVHAAAAVSAAGTAAILDDAAISTPELYALTPAVLTGVLGLWRLARDESVGSVSALRVPLALLLTPTILQVVADPYDWVRVVVLAGAAVVLGAAGVAVRWSAPVLAAAVCAVTLVLTQGFVAAVAVPRWAAFAVGGLALVAASATYERQLVRLRTTRSKVVALR
jgi:hypothetical protein